MAVVASQPKKECSFHDFQAGVKCRVRVRAIDGQGNAGPYSAPADIVAGIGTQDQLTFADPTLVLANAPGGIVASWNQIPDARYAVDGVALGYELFVIWNADDFSVNDPDPDNFATLVYRGPATSAFIPLTDNTRLFMSVLLRCYDIFGRISDPDSNVVGQLEWETPA